jgi:hypothetical protein
MFRYGLLFAGYRHKRYYWETVMVFRKVVVVAIGVFGRLTDTESQVHVALLALFTFTLMHTILVPFPRDDRSGASVGRLETFALTCCFFTMWAGLVFYHSKNLVVIQVLSIFLVAINAIFFLRGVRLFVVEFAKEQELSVSSLADRVRLSRISTIASSLSSMRLTASSRGGGNAASANEGEVKKSDLDKATMLFEDKDTKIYGNPLLLLQPKKRSSGTNPLYASGQRSLMRRGTSSFRRQARRSGTSGTANDTGFGETKKAKVQMHKIASINQKVRRKKEQQREQRRRREQEESGGIEMTDKTTRQRRKKENAADGEVKGEEERIVHHDEESGRNFYVDEETGVSHWEKEDKDDDKGDETTEVTTKKKEKRELHHDEESGRYFYVDEEGQSHWEDEDGNEEESVAVNVQDRDETEE